MPSPLRRTRPLLAVPVVLALLALVLAGCGSEEKPETTGNATTSESASPKPKPKPKPSATDGGAAIGEKARRDAARGYSVVGVRRDDRLNVRKTPSTKAPIVARLAPLTQALVPVGKEKRVGDARWQQIRVGEVRGWVNKQYVAHLGRATGHTRMLRQTPIGESRVALAVNAARELGYKTTPVVVKIKHPVVVVDLLEEGDDSVRGARLRLVIEYGEAGFQVSQAASRPICVRGVSAEGLCL